MPPEPLPDHGAAPLATVAPDALPASPGCADALPARCDVVVVGAGPAGSACAQGLAAAGWDVVLVDQQRFPRDKVCGDGLIPDAHQALRRLGVHDEVMDQAFVAPAVGCVGPRGGRIDVPAELAVLPRRQLDDILKRAAERAGARFAAPWRFEAPLTEGDQVVGALLKPLADPAGSDESDRDGAGQTQALRARWVVLATGAQPRALQAAGLCTRSWPSGVALRGHLKHPGLAERLQALDVVWHRRLRGGYGWVFPGPDGVFNIGVGLANSHGPGPVGAGVVGGRKLHMNLRALFTAFTEVYAPAAELLAQGQWVSPLKGAPLRCSLEGARFSRPGLLVTGEAAGSTFAFTGEGIGKALHTGELAAQALIEGQRAVDRAPSDTCAPLRGAAPCPEAPLPAL